MSFELNTRSILLGEGEGNTMARKIDCKGGYGEVLSEKRKCISSSLLKKNMMQTFIENKTFTFGYL